MTPAIASSSAATLPPIAFQGTVDFGGRASNETTSVFATGAGRAATPASNASTNAFEEVKRAAWSFEIARITAFATPAGKYGAASSSGFGGCVFFATSIASAEPRGNGS